jgi:hypothetical protein
LKSQNLPHWQICQLTGISENTLRSYCQAYREGGIELSTGQKLQNIEELSHLVIQIQHDIADVVESIAK